MATLTITDKETRRIKTLALSVLEGGTTKYMRGADQIIVKAVLDEYDKGRISWEWLNNADEVYSLDGADINVVKIEVSYGFWRGFRIGLVCALVLIGLALRYL